MKKYIFELSLLIGLCASLLVAAEARETQLGISEKLIRLHIIANSDSDADQRLKYVVRDEVLKHMKSLAEGCKTPAEAEEILKAHLNDFTDIADKVLKEANTPYLSSAEISFSDFPTKHYDGFSLPAGRYKALKIKLGSARGENWWCVLFPPLCVSAAEVEETLNASGLSESELKLMTSEKAEVKIKFKLLELFA